LHPVSPVKSTQVSQEVFNQFLEMQLTCFAECAQTHYVKIYQGESVNLVLPGLGGGHVREISITLHQVYGVPYLSGSSLKGVVRNWALQAFFAGDEKRGMEETDEPSEYFKAIFGTQERRGSVQFHDAFFLGGGEITPDVMTPHFSDYYSGTRAPTDDQNPIPFAFHGVKGEVRVVLTMEKRHPQELLEIAGSWTQKALTELGIGSKTAVGYGRFTNLVDVTGDLISELAAAIEQERRRRAEEIEEQKRAQEREESLASLSPGERLAFEIRSLGEDERDVGRSKGGIYRRLLDLPEAEQKSAAQALKEYWIKTGDWKKPSKKQKEKNRAVREILERT